MEGTTPETGNTVQVTQETGYWSLLREFKIEFKLLFDQSLFTHHSNILLKRANDHMNTKQVLTVMVYYNKHIHNKPFTFQLFVNTIHMYFRCEPPTYPVKYFGATGESLG